MQITYDKRVDAMYIHFNDLDIEGTYTVNSFMNVDVAEDGKIVGIELFAVSKFATDIEAIATNYDIDKVIVAEKLQSK